MSYHSDGLMAHVLPSRIAVPILAALLLALHATLAITSAWNKSPTVDEYTYIASGYLYWQTGDLRLDRTHPPLLRWWIGLPLQVFDVSMPPLQQEQWDTPASYERGYHLGWEMLLTHNDNWRSILFWARVPIMVLSLGTGLLVFLWARSLYGDAGGLISLTLACLCPTLLAHGRLATLDSGTAFFMLLVLYCVYRYGRHPSLMGVITIGITLGLALSCKVIALLWVPLVFAGFILTHRPSSERWLHRDWKTIGIHSLLCITLAAVTLALTYGFPINPVYYTDTLNNVVTKSLAGGDGGEAIPGMPHRNHAFYLLGEYSLDGFPHYYLIALLVKIPLASFVLLGWALCFRRTRYLGWTDGLLLAAMALLLVASFFNRVNIGVRHILPLLPLLYLYLGRVGLLLDSRKAIAAAGALLLWFAASSLMIYPHYLAYFNALSGGATNGHRVLDDSNLDWGQDLGLLRDVQARYPDEPLYIATDKAFVSEAFGVVAQPFSLEMVESPPEGLVAVGKHWAIRNRIRKTGAHFDWLERFVPVEEIGYSMWLYRFDADGNPLPS